MAVFLSIEAFDLIFSRYFPKFIFFKEIIVKIPKKFKIPRGNIGLF